jgi:hypothetical protein
MVKVYPQRNSTCIAKHHPAAMRHGLIKPLLNTIGLGHVNPSGPSDYPGSIRVYQADEWAIYQVYYTSRLHHTPVTSLVGGFNPSEKYEFVSWDDDIPNILKSKKMFQPDKPDHHCSLSYMGMGQTRGTNGPTIRTLRGLWFWATPA